MDKNFVISQLINAVIVIVTTIITVRFTQLGSFGVSQKLKARLTAKAAAVIEIGYPFASCLAIGLVLYYFVLAKEGPITRPDVFYISFFSTVLVFWLAESGKAAGRRQRRATKEREN